MHANLCSLQFCDPMLLLYVCLCKVCLCDGDSPSGILGLICRIDMIGRLMN